MSKIEISIERLRQLEDVENKMYHLERGGVDNWEFYGEALDEYHKEKEQEEKIDSAFEEILEELCSSAYEPSERGAGVAFEESSIASAKEIFIKLLRDVKDPNQ